MKGQGANIKPVNVAVIGAGYWGPNLARNFAQIEGTTLSWLADTDPARLDRAGERFPGVRLTKDYHELLADPVLDAVAVATPLTDHYRIARDSLKAGKHVLVEKPLATTVAECKELTALAAQSDLTLMVGHIFSYTAAVRKLKELIDADELGDLYYLRTVRAGLGKYQKSHNVIWDLAPHDISIVLHLIGKQPISVSARGSAHINPPMEDVAVTELQFEGNVTAYMQFSWLDPLKIRKCTIVGSRKMLVYDDVEQNEKVKLYDKRVDGPAEYDNFGEFAYTYFYGEMQAPYLENHEPLREECEHFIQCVREGKAPLTGGKEGADVVRILQATDISLAEQGRKVALTEVK